MVNRSLETQIAEQYRKTSRRILFLDYDGTLVPFTTDPERAVPGAHVLTQLRRLAASLAKYHRAGPQEVVKLLGCLLNGPQ